MLNKRLIYKFTDLFTGISRHNKRDFDTDYNDFVVAQDELSILADRAKSEDSLNMFLAHVDESVTGFCKYACDNHEYLSKAIQNAYLIENKKAQVEGNTSFGDVAHAVYKKFEGRITPEEFIGSSVYIECFTGKKFADALADKMQGVDVEASRYLDTPEFALEKIYRNDVGKFAGYKVIKSFCENDKIDNSIKSDAYSELKAFMPYKLRDKYAKQFGDHELEDAQPLDFENGFSERHQYKRLIRYAELYKTSKSLTKDIQRVISDGVDAGVSYNKLILIRGWLSTMILDQILMSKRLQLLNVKF